MVMNKGVAEQIGTPVEVYEKPASRFVASFIAVSYTHLDVYKRQFLYLVALLLVVLSLFVINRLLRMPLGRAWEALREDEIACRSLGLSPTRIKLTAFTISAAFAGFAGTLFAARQGFVSPESFTLSLIHISICSTATGCIWFRSSTSWRSASRHSISSQKWRGASPTNRKNCLKPLWSAWR